MKPFFWKPCDRSFLPIIVDGVDGEDVIFAVIPLPLVNPAGSRHALAPTPET